jgi:hypothetical protein
MVTSRISLAIRHQAIAEHLHAAERRILLQKAEIDLAVGAGEEDVSLGIAALGDVVRTLADYDPCESRHEKKGAGVAQDSQGI